MDGRTVDAPRDDLIRMIDLPAAELRVEAGSDGTLGRLVGYAAVFNQPTLIDSWEGRFIERIAPGAFRKTLAERGDRVKVLFNHGFDPSIGDKPLGRPEVQREDERGLYVEVPLDDTSYNRDLAALLRSGALDGQSFRFSVTKEEWTDPASATALPERTIQEVRLYEYGPVTFPAYEATTAGVRARDAFLAYRQARIAEAARPGTSNDPAPDNAEAASSGTSTQPSGRMPVRELALLRRQVKELSR